MKRVLLVFAAAGVLVCAYTTGAIDTHNAEKVATVGGWLLLAGAMLGALIGAGHARERRAWRDYQDRRAGVPEARRAWLGSLGTSTQRLAIPAVLAVLGLFWLAGRR